MATFKLVTPTWVSQNLNDETLVLIDARSPADYWRGHIAGARNFDPALLSIVRTDPASLTRFQAVLAWALSALGLTAESHVVIIGAQNDAPSAKTAWAFAYAGIQHISLLDGGLAAWPGEHVTTAASWPATPFVLTPQSEYLATAQDVLAATQQNRAVLDARSREEFDGVRSNAGRKGRIPEAKFWDNSLELNGDGQYAGTHGVTSQAQQIGITPQDNPIVYCGGGGRAARTFVALQLAGQQTAVYPASWLEWGTDPQYPIQSPSA
ncbi:Rhodanese domain-containing protein [Bordetella tumbae]|uniref:sulfurtransferase n=1 Tax=Bordetella tumbae TaxID=1649139 RepID=UPI0039EFA487